MICWIRIVHVAKLSSVMLRLGALIHQTILPGSECMTRGLRHLEEVGETPNGSVMTIA